MTALDAAARLIASSEDVLATHFERCLHSLSVEVECDACLQVCPTEAIVKREAFVFDKATCSACLACVPACPTGVFTTKSQIAGLLRCAAHSPTGEMELLCEFHPGPTGGRDENPAVRLRGCLAGIGPGTYLCLLEAGLEKLTLRCEECRTCSLASLKTEIEKTVKETLGLLRVESKKSIVIQHQHPKTEGEENGPLWNADNPPISRRELFQFTTRKGTLLAIDALGERVEASGKNVGIDRLRLNAGLQRLSAEQRLHPDTALLPFGYATVSLSDDCTACAACARICPTGALAYEQTDDCFEITFRTDLCIACDLCSKVCFLDAVKVDTSLTAKQFARAAEVVTLHRGQQKMCYRCGGWFFARGEAVLCPVCEFRSQHPFGSKLPPGISRHPPASDARA